MNNPAHPPAPPRHSFETSVNYHLMRIGESHIRAVDCSKRLENSSLSLPEKTRQTQKLLFYLTQTMLHAHYINKTMNHLIADLALGNVEGPDKV